MSLPDMVLLEILSYLSCEDALYAIVSLHSDRFDRLLAERGAFRQICLSATLPTEQYRFLLNGVWSLHAVKSLILDRVFPDFSTAFPPFRQPLPSLTHLRLIAMDYPHYSAERFILAHRLTLTHLTITSKSRSFVTSPVGELVTDVLPHLSQLVLLDTGSTSTIHVSIDNGPRLNSTRAH